VSEISVGERAWVRLCWFAYDARSRPAALLAAAAALAGGAMIGADIGRGGSFAFQGFDLSLLWIANAFGFPSQLCLAVAALLFVVDRVSGTDYRGQRLVFVALAVVGAIGVAANVTAVVVVLRNGVSSGLSGTVAEAYTGVIFEYLAPALLSAVVVWLGLAATRPGLIGPGAPR